MSVIHVVQFTAILLTMITLIVIWLLRLVVGVSHCIEMILIIWTKLAILDQLMNDSLRIVNLIFSL